MSVVRREERDFTIVLYDTHLTTANKKTTNLPAGAAASSYMGEAVVCLAMLVMFELGDALLLLVAQGKR